MCHASVCLGDELHMSHSVYLYSCLLSSLLKLAPTYIPPYPLLVLTVVSANAGTDVYIPPMLAAKFSYTPSLASRILMHIDPPVPSGASAM